MLILRVLIISVILLFVLFASVFAGLGIIYVFICIIGKISDMIFGKTKRLGNKNKQK